jgi:glycosyltransferase involved in cell wall biosynthesis
MVSFKSRLVKGFAERGIGVVDELPDTPYEAVLIIGGTRDLAGLWKARRAGLPVVQRLDGMNWIHRKAHTGLKHYVRAEYGNLLLSLIRSKLAGRVIYQSEFSRQWWERVYGKTKIPWRVVHNGVDLQQYSPDGPDEKPVDHVRLLLVEGTIGGGYEFGLETAIETGKKLHTISGREVEVMVVGRLSAKAEQVSKEAPGTQVSYVGQVPIERIPHIDRSAHVLYAADLHPACPNSVIEAMACGLPVAGFDTGALSEIVSRGAGEVVPYGGDPWKLEPPDIEGLAKAIARILMDQESYRRAARQRAEDAFGLERMLDGYLEMLEL